MTLHALRITFQTKLFIWCYSFKTLYNGTLLQLLWATLQFLYIFSTRWSFSFIHIKVVVGVFVSFLFMLGKFLNTFGRTWLADMWPSFAVAVLISFMQVKSAGAPLLLHLQKRVCRLHLFVFRAYSWRLSSSVTMHCCS